MAALYIFLGAFFYAIVYTVWLKRRTWMNIVIGGASGSFAVLAGAAVVDPQLGPVPVLLALVLFLWTPSHFWSLAIARREDYAAVGVPMLPVLRGKPSRPGWCWRTHWYWWACRSCRSSSASAGCTCWARWPAAAISSTAACCWCRILRTVNGMGSFFASLVQLILLLIFAVLDAQLPA